MQDAKGISILHEYVAYCKVDLQFYLTEEFWQSRT